jgi:hypothetical protein
MSTKGRKPVSARRRPARKPTVEGEVSAIVRPDEMSEELLAFITAIDEYKRKRGRAFPTWSEVLEVLKSLGYERRAGGGLRSS